MPKALDKKDQPSANTGAQAENQRQHERVEARFEIPYWKYVRFSRKEEAQIGFVKNISKGGVFIETDIIYPKGEEVGFEFYLTNSSKPVTGIATVMWTRSVKDAQDNLPLVPGMGLQFKTFKNDGDKVLSAFIEQALKDRQII